MTVEAVFNPNVATIDSQASVQEAAELMRHEHVGDLIVTELRNELTVPIGVITDRDIVIEIVARKAEPSQIRVGDTVWRELLALREDAGIAYALRAMHRAGVRRAPVVKATGALSGVLAIDDVLEHLADLLGEVAGTIRAQQAAEAKRLP
ncbi:MAG: CBS domain-containing protein [Gammaproteobacteria bacterium]|jgi:predicted transcriptional regulator